MLQIPTLLEMLQAGVHFGHKTARRHPKMEPFIFGERSGVHIIDLDKTMSMIRKTVETIQDMAARGAVILFVGTKKQARELISKYADDCGMPYVNNRWLGGTFTNFNEVGGLVRRYHELKEMQTSGAMARKYTKKEQLRFTREIDELEIKVGGIKNMKRLPDAVFILDCQKEKTALREAQAKEIPVIALLDTNVNPEDITHGIPSNDDAVKTIEMMIGLVAAAIKEGQAHPVALKPLAVDADAGSAKAKVIEVAN
ncbi:30S ribosomal protein S2 [Patescibacteria group bacterium]|nr:30S ribosomal protein S2 [Patescibacteria group bacterium]MBU1915729.1 30S ribosomal protein S2 [Patescibacteria group bacterium]